MRASYVIKGGRVVDPSRGIDEVTDVCIKNNRIVEAGADVECDPWHVIDATGCIVTPGLIDYHAHFFHGGSATTVYPDTLASTGMTAAVDAGTPGPATYESFYATSVCNSALRLKGYLTPWAGGQLDAGVNEDFNPAKFNRDRIARVVDRYRDNILGLKIRLSHGLVPADCAADYLRGTVELAEDLDRELGTSLRVCVHTTDCPITAGELAGQLRAGDVFTHCYQGKGNGIVLEDGTIDPGVLEARERGVLFCSANGKSNYALKTCKAALAQGFLPDIISTDATVDKTHIAPYCKNIAVLLSKYLTLGLSLSEVIAAATAAPAAAMDMAGQIGTLAPGSYADVAILKYTDEVEVHHRDCFDVELVGHDLLVPQMTFANGDPVFSYTAFAV